MNKRILFILVCSLLCILFAEDRLPDGSIFVGDKKGGLFDGEGILEWKNGDYYKGQFREGMYNGFGKLSTKAFVFEGYFKEGLFHGEGKLTFSNGTVYQGEFKENLYHGKGSVLDPQGSNFVGLFYEGMKNGMGYLRLHNGESYSGNFANDLFNGEGVYTYPNGDKYIGNFKDGLFHGYGRLITNDKTYEGVFIDGNLPEKFIGNNNYGYKIQTIVLVISIISNIFFLAYILRKYCKR